MPESRQDLYRFHVANVRSVRAALDQVARLARRAIAREDEATLIPLVRLYGLLLGTWAECRLRKVLYEDRGLNDSERVAVLGVDQQYERWTLALELSMRRHYGVPKAELVPPVVPHSAYSRYAALLNMLEKDLRPIIELRNRLAHGQWVYAFTTDEQSISAEQMRALNTENLFSLQTKLIMLEGLASIVHDLVISKTTFERDFDTHFRAVEQAKINLSTRPYSSYVGQLKHRFRNRARSS